MCRTTMTAESDGNLKSDINDELFMAMRHNDEVAVLKLLRQGADPNALTSNVIDGKSTPFHSAVRLNKASIVRCLLENGANVNIPDEDGDTPLFSALYKKIDPEIRKLLYQYGADPNHVNDAGKTPLINLLDNCVLHGFQFATQALLEILDLCTDFDKNSTNDFSLIHYMSVIHAQTDESCLDNETHICIPVLKRLIDDGVMFNTLDGTGGTILHSLSSVACYDGIQLLIKNKISVDIRAVDIKEQTALHRLGNKPNRAGFVATLDWLLHNGCGINESDCFGRTLLHYVSSSDYTCSTAISALVDRGADVNAKDKLGLTPLHMCVLPSVMTPVPEPEDDYPTKSGIDDVIALLVAAGANPNAVDSTDFTPLHFALRERDTGVVKTLLDLGSDPNMKTRTGESALHRSTIDFSTFEMFVASCRNNKIDWNMQDNFGSTALHWAIWYFETPVVHKLLEMGASLEIEDVSGRTPRDLACFTLNTSMYDELGIIYQRGIYPNDTQRHQATSDEYQKEKSLVVVPLWKFTKREQKPETVSSSENTESFVEITELSSESSNDRISDMTSDSTETDEEECRDRESMFPDCPLLRTIYSKNRSINYQPWLEHLMEHKHSLKKFVKTFILDSKDMGLFHDTCENLEISSVIHRVMVQTAIKVSEANPLLACDVSLSGSWAERTKITSPDEFDYKWNLHKFSDNFVPEETAEPLLGFARLRLRENKTGSEFQQYVDAQGYLDSRRVIRDLYTLINNVLSGNDVMNCDNLYLRKQLKVDKGSISKVAFRWVGTLYKDLLIEIDIVPAITPSNWTPSSIRVDSPLITAQPKDMKISVVLKTPESFRVKGWNTVFRISAAELEAHILQNIPTSVLKGYILVKALKDTLFLPQLYDMDNLDGLLLPHVSSYSLKTCFLQELEYSKRNETLLDSPLSNRSDSITIKWAVRIMNRLLSSIEDCKLTSFFVPGVNLLINNSLTVFNDQFMYEAECECLMWLVALGTDNLFTDTN